LASLDIRQESTRHSEAIHELTNYLDLPVPYDQMSEEEKIKWLINELDTKRPLIPSDVNWTKTTEETFSVFKMVKRLQQEFGSRICHSYVISMSHSASDLLEVLLLAKEMGLLYQNCK
jgi:phosphoenolpyruvate carboxylase